MINVNTGPDGDKLVSESDTKWEEAAAGRRMGKKQKKPNNIKGVLVRLSSMLARASRRVRAH